MRWHIFHDWTAWTEPFKEDGYLSQQRYCRICNKWEERVFK